MQTKEQYHHIIRDLISLCTLRNGKLRSIRGCFNKAREYFANKGLPVNPMGCGNAKTGLPGSYRPTGCGKNGSCPPNCPYADKGCFGQGGTPAALQAMRASVKIEAATNAYLTCTVISWLHFQAPHRANVTGDLCREGMLDWDLCQAMIECSEALRECLEGIDITGYLYTHADELDDWTRQRMLDAGCIVLRSDRLEPGAAVVYPLDEIPALREKTSVRLVECPAFRRGATCRSCQLCPRSVDLQICIVLDPHGTKARTVAETARAMH